MDDEKRAEFIEQLRAVVSYEYGEDLARQLETLVGGTSDLVIRYLDFLETRYKISPDTITQMHMDVLTEMVHWIMATVQYCFSQNHPSNN